MQHAVDDWGPTHYGIGITSWQETRELHPRVVDGHHKRRGPLADPVDAGPRPAQRLRDSNAPGAAREQHRREVAGRWDVNVGADLDEQVCNVHMVLGDGPHERSLIRLGGAGVDVRPGCEQLAHYGGISGVRGPHQYGLAMRR